MVATFVFPHRDPLAFATDAFSINWNQWDRIYLFPPTKLITTVLSHLEDFLGFSSSHNPDLANTTVVPGSSRQSQESTDNSPSQSVPAGGHETLLFKIKSIQPPNLLEFMIIVYSSSYSESSSVILTQCTRESTSRQYQTVWSSFCEFVCKSNFQVLNMESVLTYLRFLFWDKKLAPSTVSSYKAVLARPLRNAFNIDVSSNPFPDFFKALHNIKQAKTMS